MSEGQALSGGHPQSAATAVLLPAARVALHVTDADLLAAAEALKSDWRFARVTFDLQSGDIDTAIAYYTQQASPELVMVETASIGPEFTEKLGVLAGNCSEGTSAVVVGPVNDVYLYRQLIEMGVSDYLVKPISKDVLAAVITKTLIEKLGASESKLVAFIGAKGGVGTSTIARNFALISSTDISEKTIILDAAGGWSYLSVGYGQEPVTNFSEVARAISSTDQDALKRMLVQVNDKLSVLGTGADAMLDDHASAEVLEAVINRLMVSYPVVVIDLSGASANVKRMVINKAHHINLVATPTLPALRSARSLLQEIKSLKGQIENGISLILNKSGQHAGAEVTEKDIVSVMERKPVINLSYNPKAFLTSEMQGKKIVETGGENIHQSILSLVKTVLGKNPKPVEAKPVSKFSGLLSKVKGS